MATEPAASFECPDCGFQLWHPIARRECSTLGLYDDGRFPGRCLLVFHRHVEDYTRLNEHEVLNFALDAQRAARALERVTGADRINYAILGNAEPHLHYHLVPRSSEDAVPGKSPWSHPDPVVPLDPGRRQRLIEQIAAALADPALLRSVE